MKKEMETLYIEGLASRDVPESCVGVPRGRSEALTGGVRAGLLNREITVSSGCRRCSEWAEGQVFGGVIREPSGNPARSEIPGTYDKLHAREPGGPVVARGQLMMPRPKGSRGGVSTFGSGREGNAEAVIPR